MKGDSKNHIIAVQIPTWSCIIIYGYISCISVIADVVAMYVDYTCVYVYACMCACVCVYYFIESPQKDEAIEKWASMRENTYKHFRFTPKIVRFSLIWLVLVPVGLCTFANWERRYRDKLEGRKPIDYFSRS